MKPKLLITDAQYVNHPPVLSLRVGCRQWSLVPNGGSFKQTRVLAGGEWQFSSGAPAADWLAAIVATGHPLPHVQTSLERWWQALSPEAHDELHHRIARKWPTALLLARDSSCRPLWRRNPALCTLLARSIYQSEPSVGARRPQHSVAMPVWLLHLAGSSDRDIGRRLNLPDLPWCTRAIGRLVHASCDVFTVASLVDMLDDRLAHPTVSASGWPDAKRSLAKFLQHLPRLNAGVVTLLRMVGPRAPLHPSLLRTVADTTAWDLPARARSVMAPLALLGQLLAPRGRVWHKIARLRTLDELLGLARFHAKMLAVDGKFPLMVMADGDFGPAPVPETRRIRALRTARHVIAEGRLMENCLADPAQHLDAHLGRAYYYQLVSPQRATIELVRDDKTPGGWRLRQLLGASNELIPPWTRAIVNLWLDQHATRSQHALRGLHRGQDRMNDLAWLSIIADEAGASERGARCPGETTESGPTA